MTAKFLQKTLLTIVILFNALVVISAQEMEGEIRYLLVHNWTKKMMTLDYLSQQQRDRMAYMWGNDSEWKTYANLYFNSTESKYEDSEESAEHEDDGYSWRRDAYAIRRNFEKNTVFDIVTVLSKTYVIEDTLKAQDWKILNDMKEVAGHVCMNAFWEDTIKQQKITAWFALDMPAQLGPERLCGLPGIILEADINDGALLITADRIQLKKLTNELDKPKKVKGKHITEAEYREKTDELIKEKRKAEEAWFWALRY
ncbi:MAG: GLPGLI family protein [Lewinellaceae bacterium]|nr:GLPGLI family protein [Saprospiraceae bacterium]MCB9316362.1 GLPGLI family protein [Lewinellaceae bacterium]MCB9330682.1 GLPGLI family protein [Lewinellaceae bacterium]